MEEPRELTENITEAQDRVNSDPEGWYAAYGFQHRCRCAQDYAEGNMGEVTECWGKMATDALDTCRTQQAALWNIASGNIPDPVTFASEFTTSPAS